MVVIVFLVGLALLVPMVLMFTGSFMGGGERAGAYERLIPRKPTFENYADLFKYNRVFR